MDDITSLSFDGKIDYHLPTLPTLRNLTNILFANIDLRDGLPIEVYQCKKLRYLTCYRCQLSFLDESIKYLPLESVDISQNEFRIFPYVLLSNPNIIDIDISYNYIEELDDSYDYKSIVIDLKGQYINKIPSKGGIFENIEAQYAEIDTILNNNNYTIGPSNNWINRNSENVRRCCSIAKIYTHRGDRALNTCLRKQVLPPELVAFYDTMIEAQENMEFLPYPMVVFRGIREDFAQHLNINTILVDYGFSSFSFSIKVAESFTKNSILIWPIKEEVKGIVLNPHFGMSHYDEKEVVFGPGLKVKVSNIIRSGKYTYYILDYVGYETVSYKSIDNKEKFGKIFSIMKENPTGGIIINDKFYLNTYANRFENLIVEFYRSGISALNDDMSRVSWGNFLSFFVDIFSDIGNEYFSVHGDIEILLHDFYTPKHTISQDDNTTITIPKGDGSLKEIYDALSYQKLIFINNNKVTYTQFFL